MMDEVSNREWSNVGGRPQGSPPHPASTPAPTMNVLGRGRPQGSPPHPASTPAPTMNERFSNDFAVGVDGGGTKTLAVVVDAQGNERGRGMAGSANYTGVGVELAVQHIYSAVKEAARQAGCR